MSRQNNVRAFARGTWSERRRSISALRFLQDSRNSSSFSPTTTSRQLKRYHCVIFNSPSNRLSNYPDLNSGMAEEAELKAKIAALNSQIDQVKQQPPAYAAHGGHSPFRNHASQSWRGQNRWFSPYSRGGRGGRAGYKHVQNRSLVLNAPSSTPTPPSEPSTPHNEPATVSNTPKDGYIAARRPGTNQLINREAYDREQKQKQEQHERTRAAKRHKVDREERTKLHQYASGQGNRELIVEGIRFQLREDGSKLIRISGKTARTTLFGHSDGILSFADNDEGKETPRKVTIADVDFFRTKTGNLVRANALKTTTRYQLTEISHNAGRNSRYSYGRLQPRKSSIQCEEFVKHGTHPSNHELDLDHLRTRAHRFALAGKSCSSLTHVAGTCPRGPMCRYAHDPNKVAICTKFLRSACSKGDDCDLSHSPTYSNTPACTHFLRGNCTKDACRYPHVHVSPTASVCAPFARLGYCSNQDCGKRHVFECPDYANTGYCAKAASGLCSLPHPDHAAAMRKAAAKQAKMEIENDSDLSSEEDDEENMPAFEDIDSDDVEDMTDVQTYDHELTQQQDYVAFS